MDLTDSWQGALIRHTDSLDLSPIVCLFDTVNESFFCLLAIRAVNLVWGFPFSETLPNIFVKLLLEIRSTVTKCPLFVLEGLEDYLRHGWWLRNYFFVGFVFLPQFVIA